MPLDPSHLTASEREVLECALESYDEESARVGATSPVPARARYAKWHAFEAARLLETLRNR